MYYYYYYYLLLLFVNFCKYFVTYVTYFIAF